jgi:hypothetical protein
VLIYSFRQTFQVEIMKFLLTSLLALSVLHFQAIAEEAKPAPPEVLKEIKQECAEYAKEDEIPKEELSEYMLNCVNDELAERGFAPLKKL